MLFLDEIRKVSKETPVPRDSKNRPQKVFKKKRRSSSDEEKHHKATKQYFGGICSIDKSLALLNLSSKNPLQSLWNKKQRLKNYSRAKNNLICLFESRHHVSGYFGVEIYNIFN